METNVQSESNVHPFNEDFHRGNPNFMAQEFFGCPKCGGNDGAVFIGRESGCWCICRSHKTKWFIEPDISYRASQYAKGLVRALPPMTLDGYEQVEPVSLEPL